MHEHEYVSEELLCVLAGIAGEDNVLMTEPMRDYTTFHIGGPADVLVTPRTPVDSSRCSTPAIWVMFR